MTISIASRRHSGNTGIVPPWLNPGKPDDTETREPHTASEVEKLLAHNGFVEFVCDELPIRG